MDCHLRLHPDNPHLSPDPGPRQVVYRCPPRDNSRSRHHHRCHLRLHPLPSLPVKGARQEPPYHGFENRNKDLLDA